MNRPPPRLFDAGQLVRVRRALATAAECLESYYRFSPREWFPYGYDLITCRDLGPDRPSRPAHVLAEVVRNLPRERKAEAGATHPFPLGDVFTIILYDDNILCLTDGAPDAHFDRLLLYVLTHELVHVARFFHLVDYEAPETERLTEEALVHRLTWRVLGRLKDEALAALAERYASGEYSF